jgi:hypothetical protein
MLSTVKIKWLGSLFLAGIMLVSALMGGNWGSINAADASVNIAAIVERIQPSAVHVGSQYIVMIIYGDNFVNDDYTRVRLTAPGFDKILEPPQQILPDGISQVIPASLLVEPKVYSLTVVHSTAQTVPTIPIVPPQDEESNPVPFVVFVPHYVNLPMLLR